jgi:hypothetical protein
MGDDFLNRGIYNDLNIFVDEIKNTISKRQGISVDEIDIEVDDLSDANYILVIYDEYEDMLVILKKRGEWFYVRLTFTEPFLYRPESKFIADQRDGLQNLLSEILENRI